ncbi:unnamed protein product [Albugo candida]|nr:unnamed protein product [Albugo candida]|eukprot:CCI47107.1 unnamed protein product [Albugo candida]
MRRNDIKEVHPSPSVVILPFKLDTHTLSQKHQKAIDPAHHLLYLQPDCLADREPKLYIPHPSLAEKMRMHLDDADQELADDGQGKHSSRKDRTNWDGNDIRRVWGSVFCV